MRYLIFTLLLSFTFSECNDLNATQCESNSNCEWIEDIEWGNCGDYNSGWACDNAHENCYWDLCYGGSYGSWSHCCRGGSFQTDNGYCQENSNPPPTCSEMNALQCSSNASCEWVEDIDYGNCGSIGNPTTCEDVGCNWSCGFYHGSCAGCCYYECDGGSYQIDNSYCQENCTTQTCYDMNAAQCGTNENCQWIEEEWFDCDDFSASSGACNQYSEYGCHWDCSDYGWYCDCDGPEFQINEAHCEPNDPTQCSQLNENYCNHPEYGEGCNWTENIEWGFCENINPVWQNGGHVCDDETTNSDNCYVDNCIDENGQSSICCSGENYTICDNSYCEESDYIQGDLNGDLILNVLDVIIIIDIILNQESNDLADINGDGIVNVLDVVELVDIIINT
tara:strand:+ start:1598 stop:2776 length:1179 start_codon:yes stop_codon:yes gene_type:complete